MFDGGRYETEKSWKDMHCKVVLKFVNMGLLHRVDRLNEAT